MANEQVTQQNHPDMPGKGFGLVVENNPYSWPNQYITGADIKHLAHLSLDANLFLAVTEPWNDQIIGNDQKINLGRTDIEHFYVKRNLHLIINKRSFEWPREFITGRQIRFLGAIDTFDEIFLEIAKPGKDELIEDDKKINLALPGVENFYSRERVKEIIIIVNGTSKKWDKKQISFKEVVTLAFGNYIDRPTIVYTVGYEDGPKENPEGTMVKDDIVFVKNKMIFHATATDKS